MKKKKGRVFKHTETDLQNVTMVNLGSDEGKQTFDDLKKKYAMRGIPVKIKDDAGHEHDFYAVDFRTLTDNAGDPVLHFKLKAKNLILYLTTPHPDSLKCLQDLKNSVMGFPFEIVFRDYMIDIKDMLRTMQQKGKQDLKNGIHPKMKEYFEKDLK